MCAKSTRCGEHDGSGLLAVYRAGGILLYIVLYPCVLLLNRFWPQDRYGLAQRLGLREPSWRTQPGAGSQRIWIHAASVGEVAAAAVLIRELRACGRSLDIVLTTMTVQGLEIARQHIPQDICSFLAPLDVPPVVRRTVSGIRPDMYICLEAELWPVILSELRKAGTTMLLLNGRMTARSFSRYRLVRGMMKSLLQGFSTVAAIGADDGDRFAGLGVGAERIQVTGNVKFDFTQEDFPERRRQYRKRLGVEREAVFLCGSTRHGEERLLAEVYQTLAAHAAETLVWVIAPRHIQRIPEIKEMLTAQGLVFDLYSELAHRTRRHRIILVDCLGELAQLYSAGDYNFVGGSLVARGGHNIMEVARWGLPVYYGPHIDDFKDAAHILEEAGAGFRVTDIRQLIDRIGSHMKDTAAYQQACAAAAAVVAGHQGAARRQAELAIDLLAGSGENEQDR